MAGYLPSVDGSVEGNPHNQRVRIWKNIGQFCNGSVLDDSALDLSSIVQRI